MTTLPFLSEQWLEAVEQLRTAHLAAAPAQPADGDRGAPVRINQTVTGVPFGDGTVLLHVDTSGLSFPLGLGHLDNADVLLELGYPVARALLVDGDPQTVMQAFMTGQLRVHGEMAKLILAQQQMPHLFGPELAARIRQMTG